MSIIFYVVRALFLNLACYFVHDMRQGALFFILNDTNSGHKTQKPNLITEVS